MLVKNPCGDELDTQKKGFQDTILKEEIQLWKKQKEYERLKKLHEQREIRLIDVRKLLTQTPSIHNFQVREMLNNYWPWGRGTDAKPRGLRNLRLEELFPNKDYQKAKRFVGTWDLERGGGGAPVVNNGRKVTRTREDPILRFQFGSKDLRRCVDNTLRYKTSKEKQLEYKKQLGETILT
ncbi:hypothetical protein NQ315_017321 [Exocentrus adspersus]|uniref:Uncharacterized protein n=1 Tax=Exocentrus adspersus TaxID=1586481 RepID=A0AAV8VDT4_9CUCU|nr:hypothetical protein NQ315_017321 [Exocentrus adspersus]